ncbi:RNA polymerase sigma-E factor protein [Lysobacter dokdonensis DS-58]|uniref:RNA polymerase sigma-E factor protein n=1 Tax=Lysobacter dokdonensis DS-58 TaxID=1300345 RepID=A0A0A2WHS0_9GAMM|nr:RNA polymerase sigma factor [Lysobacter dokdonensis]KGQ18252.1 RNA polymerase sigma-E factor protein [Lysobacter dokdonensis DS-58]
MAQQGPCDGRTGTPPQATDRSIAMDEVDLVGLVAMEDVRAFEALYRAYHPRLRRFLRGMLRQSTMVDEVLDDTMLVAWRKAHTFDATSRVSTWLFAIAYRQALKALRRLDWSLPDPIDEPAAPRDAEPDGELAHAQLRERLDAVLAQLSPEHRAVIDLTYFHGYSCKEIADVVGCPVATVKTRMFYARRHMKSLLGDEGAQAL